MKNYITPMVLAATVGMCVTTRPVRWIVLTSAQPVSPAPAEELRLPVGDGDSEDTAEALRALLEARNLPADVQIETEALAARFHALVDREFLGILTPEEEQELESLTRWRDDEKAAFYREVALEQKS